MPEISVIVPVYNVEPYIYVCIDSILSQTFSDFELILVDDGSPDNCGEICDKYVLKDERIKVTHQQNRGLSEARNVGINLATGEYITFIDSDDYIYPTFLEELRNAILQTKSNISLCSFIRFKEKIDNDNKNESESERIQVIDGKQACMKIYQPDSGFHNVNFVTAWGKLYQSILFSELRYPVGRIHEDEFTTYKTFFASSKVAVVEKKLYAYRENPTSIMNSFTPKRTDDFVALSECIHFYHLHGEEMLAECASKYLEYVIAKYSLVARKEKALKMLPRCYRMNFWRAVRIMKNWKGVDYFEYEMIGLYPSLVKSQAILRRISRCFIKNM